MPFLKWAGSSPRARGTRAPRRCGLSKASVHPRGRGEHFRGYIADGRCVGSSPRARGTRVRPSSTTTWAPVHPRGRGEHAQEEADCHCGFRFIPAGAGNTARHWPARLAQHGSSPRARGTRSGLSGAGPPATVHPRGRGEHARPRCARPAAYRFIPAGAGNTALGAAVPLARFGSSPRARGTRARRPACSAGRRFIPAGAGNTHDRCSNQDMGAVHPRGRGEHGEGGFAGDGGERFIPAGAGNTVARDDDDPCAAVHPRGRGEHS